jgi:hypothetical protein
VQGPRTKSKSTINFSATLLCILILTPATTVQYSMDKAIETKNEFLSATYERASHKLCLRKVYITHWNINVYSCFHNKVIVNAMADYKIMIYRT